MCESGHHHHAQGHGHAHHLGSTEPLSGVRVVVTGKGGVGKTSLTALMSRLWGRRGHRVLALDADPQMNLPFALGVPADAARRIVPLSQNADYIEEKVGARPGSGWGLFLRLNPDVDDVVDRFGLRGPDGVRLLVMGTVVQPAVGCLCPENSLLASVVAAMSLRDGEGIVMDTQAGVEHFGRALARGFHHAVITTDVSFNGALVALQSARLAQQMGIPAIHLVVNRVQRDADLVKTLGRINDGGGFPFTSTTVLPYDRALAEADPDVGPGLESEAASAMNTLLETLAETRARVPTCAS